MPLASIAAIALPLALAALALVVPPRWSGRIALAGPAAIAAAGFALWGTTASGPRPLALARWIPALGIDLRLVIDRLGVFFLLVIGLVGLAVFQYARIYLGSEATRGFWALLLLFAASMSGVVLADDLVLFYLFWEGTTVASALLIGGNGRRPEARRGAVQAFLVTELGGLCLLAGIVLLGQVAGADEFSLLAARSEELRADPRHMVPLGLMLVGALAKSAQFPFHFWLPGAMAATTPVSAYLHSATMVQAGLVLVARLLPAFGPSPLWLPLLATVGLVTFVVAGWSAVRSWDLKQLLAYGTAAYLGMATAYYGYVGREGRHDDLLLVANHALYKAALFLLVGWIEKVTGTRDLRTLAPERWVQHVPVGAVLFAVGALAMGGAPLTLGFAAKELFLATLLQGPGGWVRWSVAAVAVLGSALTFGAACKFATVFFGPEPPPLERGRPRWEVSLWLLVVPALLLVPQALGGLAPRWLAEGIQPGTAVPGGWAIWHHLDALLALGLASFALGALLFRIWQPLARLPPRFGTRDLAERIGGALLRWTPLLGKASQAGGHPRYLVIVVAFSLLVALGAARVPAPLPWPPLAPGSGAGLAWVPAVPVAAGAAGALLLPARASKVMSLGLAGFGVALFYALFRAPDLVLTQILVESLSLVLVLLALAELPQVGVEHRRPATKLLHGAFALAAGLSLAALTLGAAGVPVADPAGQRQYAASLPDAHGRNAVNTILVDFRGADTLGEIAVLAIAALGALLVSSGTTGHPPPRPPESPILRRVARGLLPGALVFALYLLVRGHDAPGGGFIAGLVISLAFALEGIALGSAIGRRRFRGRSYGALALGLALALGAASLALVRGEPFFTHLAGGPSLGNGPIFATTLLFEVGVALVVAATTSVFASVFRGRGDA